MGDEDDDDDRVDVAINNIGDDSQDEVTMRADPTQTMGDVRKDLADMFDRVEILTEGVFVKQMPNGTTVPIHDAQKLGTRRQLLYQGPPLRPPSEAPPPVNLAEFDGLDERLEIGSPRSLRAMKLQGVVPDELYYAPPEAFWEPGLDDMIMYLHHDFFEAWRLDTLAMCLAARERIIAEEGDVEESWAEQSHREWMGQIHDWWSHGKDGPEPSKLSRPSDAVAVLPKMATVNDPDEQIAGTGGNWAGALEPYSYPIVNAFMEGIRHWANLERVLERPLKGEEKDPNANRFGPGGSPAGHKPPRLDLDAPNMKAMKATKEVEKLVKQLKRIKREKARPQMAGLVLQTNSQAVVQLRKNHQARRRTQNDVKLTTEFMVYVAEYQREKADDHFKEVLDWREHREACSIESRGPWKTVGQETQFNIAYRRAEYWHERRDAIHQQQLEDEDERNKANSQRTKDDIALKKNVANIRDLTRIRFARNWLDRRIRWAKCETVVAKANDAWKTSIMNKHAEAQARVHDRNIRLAKFIELKREYKALRRMLQSMSEGRETARQRCRRDAVMHELSSIAEAASPPAAQAETSADVTQKPLETSVSDDDEDATVRGKDGWRSRRPMHLSMSAMSSPTAGSTMRLDMTATPTSAQGSPMSRASPASAKQAPAVDTSWMPQHRVVKRQPRFDFGRFGAESLTPLAGAKGTPASQTLKMSLSSPSLLATS
mmetsp:Transcript_25816/g.46696  ORF Transcript_25816/g.46696 Transcript_25816/m.46696 type:complete len:715 (-) Transcript_25816:58-2202(-)|eukprot:CAMPEP_0197662036 /NCGR_PEP_ID=MMETSP1338-20131121/51916_1 /TAXON_ID=43686 ORGANISM="Pelagodinium beii, Strain RCC1491" /NCGR_SAMPLE_ID=MMETSP1338 /ASSEMBLY_ACC=CAM_ASM_000754 /LENGTH=714 /DNA_ID=CAMNT_0043239717 /DNA_START=77 /DNA_END=2221 /DNA_ORIENTATION=-